MVPCFPVSFSPQAVLIPSACPVPILKNSFPMESLLTYLIVCPLVFLAGFVDAIAGGGGLISLPAYMIAGIPVHGTISTNKFSCSLGTAVAAWRFWKKGYIHIKDAAISAPFALAGSALGARLALLINDRVFTVLMLVILPLTALYLLRLKGLGEAKAPYSRIKTLTFCSMIALCIGLYDGVYGPGTGTFMLLLFMGVAHLGVNDAAGLTKAINLTSNLSALAVFLWHGTVLMPLALVAAVFSILGNYAGARVFEKGGARSMKPLIISVLTIFFVKICWELLQ